MAAEPRLIVDHSKGSTLIFSSYFLANGLRLRPAKSKVESYCIGAAGGKIDYRPEFHRYNLPTILCLNDKKIRE